MARPHPSGWAVLGLELLVVPAPAEVATRGCAPQEGLQLVHSGPLCSPGPPPPLLPALLLVPALLMLALFLHGLFFLLGRGQLRSWGHQDSKLPSRHLGGGRQGAYLFAFLLLLFLLFCGRLALLICREDTAWACGFPACVGRGGLGGSQGPEGALRPVGAQSTHLPMGRHTSALARAWEGPFLSILGTRNFWDTSHVSAELGSGGPGWRVGTGTGSRAAARGHKAPRELHRPTDHATFPRGGGT